ncbi:hypothetical protein [Francisella sp. TX07-6608]|uniref:hypothetical protein n=1 Tax=Francisella sp. TX07-6608 TaxID=573568 RepID=UPI0008F9B39D|nr:hypothetical protein [Francisella sp. TX07-6608]OIN83956.1 hypothetical protein KX00_1903 [Francisella sp. TX07-6608]
MNWAIIISIISAIGAIASAIFAWKSYSINRKSFENSIKPFIILEIVPDYQSHINIFILKVKNDGFTIARDISFKVINNNELAELVGDIGFVKTGISNLSPKQELSTFIFKAYEPQNEKLFDLSVDIKITYMLLNNRVETVKQNLSLKHFVGMKYMTSSIEMLLKNTSKSVKDVAINVGKVARALENNNDK